MSRDNRDMMSKTYRRSQTRERGIMLDKDQLNDIVAGIAKNYSEREEIFFSWTRASIKSAPRSSAACLKSSASC